jgi:hypothetical protein
MKNMRMMASRIFISRFFSKDKIEYLCVYKFYFVKKTTKFYYVDYLPYIRKIDILLLQ